MPAGPDRSEELRLPIGDADPDVTGGDRFGKRIQDVLDPHLYGTDRGETFEQLGQTGLRRDLEPWPGARLLVEREHIVEARQI